MPENKTILAQERTHDLPKGPTMARMELEHIREVWGRAPTGVQKEIPESLLFIFIQKGAKS